MRSVKKWQQYRLLTSLICTLHGYLAFYLFIRIVIYLSFQPTYPRRLPAVCQARDNAWCSVTHRPNSCLLNATAKLKTTPKEEFNQREAVDFLTCCQTRKRETACHPAPPRNTGVSRGETVLRREDGLGEGRGQGSQRTLYF